MQSNQLHTSRQSGGPLVSFVIPCWNLPIPLLGKCIDSIMALDMTAAEREIIVVDDGSDVSPINALMHYGDDIVYVRQKNGGLSSARNKGIEIATGVFIQFVDGDDTLIKGAYDACLRELRNHTDTDMLMFDFANTPTEVQPAPVFHTYSGTDYMRHHNLRGTACGYLLRKATLGELRFTQGIYHEDEEFTPQLLIRCERLMVTDARAYCYQRRTGSITTQSDKAQVSKRLDDCHDVIVRLREKADRLPQYDRLALSRRVAQLTMDYLYKVMTQTRSKQELEKRVEQLRQEGLFPLPDRDYTTKYQWFRRLSGTALGRTLLLKSLPLMKKER